jgi:hypothetical protein
MAKHSATTSSPDLPSAAAIMQRLDEQRELLRAIWNRLCRLEDELLASRHDRDGDRS